MPEPQTSEPEPTGQRARKRIAILGGGLGGLAAAFELTSRPRWYDHYSITIYQKGWRLGGKGASGRGANGRIEEHGLHCFWGFYDNAFRMLRDCYWELDRQTGPIRTLNDAFKKLSSVWFIDRVGGQWRRYEMHFPENSAEPGGGPREDAELTTLSVKALGERYLRQIRAVLADHEDVKGPFERAAGDMNRALATIADAWTGVGVRGAGPDGAAGAGDAALQRAAARTLLEALVSVEPPTLDGSAVAGATAAAAAAAMGAATAAGAAAVAGPRSADAQAAKASASQKSGAKDSAAKDSAGKDSAAEPADVFAFGTPDDAYRRYVLFQAAKFAFVMFAGLLAEGIPTSLEDFDAKFDDRDLRQWLKQHGADKTLLDSPIVTGLYNASFCYPGGDLTRGDLAAGVSLRTVLLMGFTYKGAFMWKMQSSMGDVVFAPLYEALARRGKLADADSGQPGSLTFEFFQDVKKLARSESGSAQPSIDTIEIDEQATLADAHYAPLFDVRGLPCWPSAPRFEQLVNGDALRGFDFESDWNTPPPVRKRVLRRGAAGRDGFDSVVLGIPVGALRTICGDLVEADPRWRSMVDGVKTIRTKSFQVWLPRTDAQHAWQSTHRIMTDVYENDFNSIADMHQTLDLEDWPVSMRPGGVLYSSCAMADDPHEPAPHTQSGYPHSQDAVVEGEARTWLTTWYGGICGWLASYDPRAFGDLYVRANISADQRYTLSVAKSTKYRLAPNDSGFANLFLAGDWTKSPLNLGCAEGATMSGMLAGEAAASDLASRAASLSTRGAAAKAQATTEAPPAFIDYPGMPVYPPTYHQQGLTLCPFVLRASQSKMQALVDRLLNAGVAHGSFRVLGRWALLQTGYIEKNGSDGIGAKYGKGAETSAAFLIPVLRWRDGLPVDFGFFAPYVFVDQPLSLIAGREVLGMPKHIAQFRPATAPANLDDMTIETMVVDELGPESPVELRPLLTIRRATSLDAAELEGATFTSVAELAIDALLSTSGAPDGSAARALLQRLLGDRHAHFFSVRQLRGEDPSRAVFQEVTRGIMRLGRVEVGPLGRSHTIEIIKRASHPIAADLGLDEGPIVPVAALRIRVDEARLDRNG